jgi:hypothetical protein
MIALAAKVAQLRRNEMTNLPCGAAVKHIIQTKMNNYFKYFGIMMLSIGLFFSSCTKEVVGPAGPQGEQGPAGPAGPTGAAGQDGNANVKAYTFTGAPSAWVSFGTYGSAGYGYGIDLAVPAITSSILNNGAVLIYRYISTTGYYVLLPYSFPNSGYVETYLTAYKTGEARVERYDTDLYTTSPASTWEFKVIVIAGSQRLANPDLDLTNYEEVMAFYGLKLK